MDLKKEKKCSSCELTKSVDEFWRSSRSPDGRRYSCKSCQGLKKVARAAKNPLLIYKKYKRDAIRRNINFELSEKEFLKLAKLENCIYCNEDLDRVRLDRVDNSKGYNIDNVVPCCWSCNSFKGSLDQKDFLTRISKIYLHQRKFNNVE